VMEHFRAFLNSQKVVPAAALPKLPRNSACRVGGLVITRQRPGTAKGFVFLTIEDETGLVNVIVRPDVYEIYRRPIRSSSTLIVEGTLQKESGCVDVLAKKIWSFDDDGITRTVAVHSFG
jgi:error-prone DNA polymerase